MNDERFQKGLQARRKVMGDEYVDKALDSATDFTLPLQQMVTEHCWADVWTQDVLPQKTLSMITLATLAALKAPNELKGHVRGALRNGCTVEEIQAVLLHATVYCGMPAGIDAFRSAKEIIEQWQQEQAENS